MRTWIRFVLVTAALAVAVSPAIATPVINEIMFHPGDPEVIGQEWFEIHNPDATPVNAGGWKINKGVKFTFPSGTTIPAGGYLVVAADVTVFQAMHPGFAGQVVGGWTGKLSSSGEQIQIDDASGAKVDDVSYADSGDWAVRGRGVLSFSHKGWDWFSEADGGGRTLELRNPALGNGSGQNWGVSTVFGGTPGEVNSIASSNVAPLVKDARHRPEIPKSTEPIVVSCELEDEAAGAMATLHWRLDAGTWQQLAMSDTDGDGHVEATIPAQANLAVIEWYISASDATTNTRTWPAAARTSDPGVTPETFAQAANALVQVDDAFDPNATFRTAADAPIYRLIMTEAERAELAQIGSTSGQEESAAAMNGTFISHDGTGLKVRYLCGFRNRGQGSALASAVFPNNYHVGFRSDARWNDRSSVGLNCRYGYSQVLGQALMVRAGLATQDAANVRVRVNGADLATVRMFGRYARLEGRSGEMVEHHFPLDPEGNFYRLDDHAPGAVGTPAGNLGSGEFRYEGTNPAAYSDCFIKETNEEYFDYTDLINFCRVVSAPATGGIAEQPAISDAAYPAAVAAVLDLDNFYRFIAADALLGNMEGGLQSGRGDDASIFAGVNDPRFRFIPHDLDTIFDIGDTVNGVTRNIFSYDGGTSPGTGVLGLTRLFNHPQLVPRYYAALLDALNTWFNSATVDPIVDQIMAGWVPATDGAAAVPNRGIQEIKAYVATRRTNVLAAIQQGYSLTTTVGGMDTPEGYKRTLDGAATFGGTFNVARTYSITLNGQLVTAMNYRTTATTTAGTWSMVVPAGGGTVLHPGLNRVVVKFWDAPGGAGNVLNTLTVDVLSQPAAPSYTNVFGALVAGSLRLTAPATYIPGKPFVVRADVLDAAGNLDRAVWDGAVNLSASVAGLTLPAIQLYNGVGSALVTVGGGSGGTGTTLVERGGTSTAPNAAAATWKFYNSNATPPAAGWNTAAGYDDSTWGSGVPEFGVNDGDERTLVTAPASTRPTYYFRHKFNVADPSVFATLTLRVVYDDGIAMYLNGSELRRLNLAAGATHTSFASSSRIPPAESAIETYTVPASALVAGENLIAVEVHNASTTADVSFDLEVVGNPPASDPGNFTLSASFSSGSSSFAAQKALTSLTSSPAITPVSGTLATGTTNWSGVIQVTGDVTVPTGGTLNIAAGTHILVDGDATAGSTAGKRIIVNGALNSNGTFAQPVAITATNAADRWGGFLFSAAQPSVMNYTFINHAGHTAGVGHTGRGPMIRLTGSSLNFDDSVLADGPAKAIYSSGTLDLNIRRSLIERMITGPELGDGCALLIEDSNIQRTLPDYRESNAPTPDDEDCLYVHNGSGRSVVIRRAVFARCGDDVFDCLGGPITVEDSILREGWDKGMSLLNNDLTITRTQIIKCDKAIVPKSQNADTRTVTARNCTIVSENHDTTLAPWGYSVPPSSPDPDTPSTGFYTQNKSGQSNAAAILAINAKNCIVQAQAPVLVDAPYDPVNTVVTYSDLTLLDNTAFAWPGTGNIGADPLFANAATGNYRITATSPCRGTGDPTAADPDTTIADMGALHFGGGAAGGGTLTWTPAGGPYRLTANTMVPAGTTLVIQPGTAVYADQNVRLTVNGRIQAIGTAGARITFSHVPGTVAAGDADPIKNGTQTGAPKWGGIRVIDSMAQENVFRYCDFINAQGTDPATSENYGSLGFIRSWGWADNLTFAGTHLRMCYGRNSKLTVTHCDFPDMFIYDAALGRIEEPTTDFLASADNRMEPLKVEFPVTDPEVLGANAANFPNGLPLNGHWRVYFNDFHGNRGHQDVFDADSGRWAPRDPVRNFQTNGQFMLDCRFNHFHGLAGDEHIDLGGDAYIASNIFERGNKDYWTKDTGYSNAISSGDKGSGTTIMVARNLAFDLDHVINCKASTATIFEHNTVANLHADFQFTGQTVTQNVVCAPVNFYIPGDGNSPTYGDGAYVGFNIVSNVAHMFSGPDTRDADATSGINNVHDITTKIEFNHNLLDQIADPVIGPNHPGGFFSGTFGPNTAGAPGFVDAANKNYSLRADSLARGTTPHGFDYGASIPEWAYVVGGPTEAGTTAATDASFTIGGPGIVAFKWRLNGGAWSAPVQIGEGGVLPRAKPTIRQATLNLTALVPGAQTLEVLGQDMAGNWQDADPARTLEGLAQAAPTTRRWTVDTSFIGVRLSEILADSATRGDTVELQNVSGSSVGLAGWSLTDDPLLPNKLPLSGTLAAGAYGTVSNAALALDRDGDSVYLYQGGVLRDSITFGQQITDKTIGRNVIGAWTLCAPTLGAANTPIPVGDYSTVKISEWFASGDVLYGSDWIELQNTNMNPVLLAGLRLTENRAGNASAYTFPALSFIAGSGYLRVIADGSSSPGHLPFALDAEYEVLSLLGASDAVIDTIAFYPQTTDRSMGRDAAGALTFYELPTRGLANETTSPAYLNALAILRGLRITEIMYNPLGGTTYEFLELKNVGPSGFDLNGAKFVNGITFTFGTLTMNPGDTVVLVNNLAKFRSRYGNAPVVAGVYSGALDNSGEVLAIQLPPPYDANVLSFSFSDGWFTSTDGGGRSLVVPNPLVAAGVYGDRDTWLASTNNGGDPAGAMLPPLGIYADWAATFAIPNGTYDGDKDGVPALVEFGLGLSPAGGLDIDPVAVQVISVTFDGRLELHLLLPENALATQQHGMSELVYTVQASSDLASWTTVATKSFTTAWSGAGTVTVGSAAGGLVPVTVTDDAAAVNRYVRLMVSSAP